MTRTTENRLNFESRLSAARESIRIGLEYAQRPIVTTKFGPDSATCLHLLTREFPNITVVWIDTGCNSRETLRFVEELTHLLSLNLQSFHAHDHPYKLIPDAHTDEFLDFVNAVKILPFQDALRTLEPDVWFSGLRRYQTEHRSSQNTFKQSSPQMLKVHPLLDWSPDNMKHYEAEFSLPTGPDCIDPTKPRLRVECGLHTQDWSQNAPVYSQ